MLVADTLGLLPRRLMAPDTVIVTSGGAPPGSGLGQLELKQKNLPGFPNPTAGDTVEFAVAVPGVAVVESVPNGTLGLAVE
jgi:hypothetical protein